MSADCPFDTGSVATDKIVCHCLRVYESTLAEAISTSDAENVRDLRKLTGAGGGCMACHGKLRRLIQETRQQATGLGCDQ